MLYLFIEDTEVYLIAVTLYFGNSDLPVETMDCYQVYLILATAIPPRRNLRHTFLFCIFLTEIFLKHQTAVLCIAIRYYLSEQTHIIHSQHLWILSALAAEFDVPLVVTTHASDLMGYDKWLVLRDYANKAADASRKILCTSKKNEDAVLKTFPAHASKVVRIDAGYNSSIFYPQDINPAEELARYGVPYKGERIVLTAGKLAHFKGVDVLLEAAKNYGQATPQAPAAITLITGDGALRGELEEQALQEGLDKVYFLGNVSQEDLCRLYSCADVNVVPSRRDPAGLVAVEAMACGTPVVVANEEGISDFVNESVGALVPVEDAFALAQAIDDVLARAQANPAWRQFIAGYASSSFSQAAIIEEMEALYRSVL